MSNQNPLNYTTTIEAAKTAGECIARLAGHGASGIGISYDQGFPTGLKFSVETAWGERYYTLPVNVEGTHRALAKAHKAGRIPLRYASVEQAKRVAWRVLKDWLEAQLALIEAGVAEMQQVMLPYMQVDEVGTTLWDRYLDNEQRAIEAAR